MLLFCDRKHEPITGFLSSLFWPKGENNGATSSPLIRPFSRGGKSQNAPTAGCQAAQRAEADISMIPWADKADTV